MLSFFQRDDLDKIWDVIGSVLRGFLPTLLPSVSKTRNTEIGRALKHDSIECRPFSFNLSTKPSMR